MINYLPTFGYLALDGFEKNLENELDIIEKYGRLYLSKTLPNEVYWAQNIWLKPFKKNISSISDAANTLKNLQRNWSLYSFQNHRRAQLIEEKLPYISKKPLAFPLLLPQAPMGSFTLIEKDLLLASAECSSLFANGEPNFIQTKEPPSRAYLKLYEIFTLLQKMPKKDEVCLELGASPGSWSFVLATLGAEVYSIDRAPLAENISSLKNVHFQKGDAFSLKPKDFPKIDWFFSDVICYPQKLFDYLQIWLDVCDNFVCTLKFQGMPGRDIIKKFSMIPNSKIFHLSCNKNELTWVRLKHQ